MNPLGFVLLLFLQLRLCLAASYVPLDLSSGLYTFSSGWTKTDAGTYQTTNGSVQISFSGFNFSVPSVANPDASIHIYVDGQDKGVQPVTWLSQASLQSEGDHQLIIKATAPESSPYIFNGIAFPSNTTTLNIKQYTPATYSVNATVVPSDALILDNTNPCVRYTKGTGWVTEEANWMSYNGSSAVSRDGGAASMTIYFQGTDIWLFTAVTALNVTASAYLHARIDQGLVSDITPFKTTSGSVPLNQWFLWSANNLTDGPHTLVLDMAHGEQDTMSFDFARVKGTPRDCTGLPDPYITYGTTYPFGRGDTWLVAVIVSLFAVPLMFCCGCCVFCYFESRNYPPLSRRIIRASYTPTKSEEGETPSAEEEDSASFRSVMAHNPENGPRALRLSTTSFDYPVELTHGHSAATGISPYTPGALPSDGSPYGRYGVDVGPGVRREGKWVANHAWIGSVGAGGISGVLVDLGEQLGATVPSTSARDTETQTGLGSSAEGGTSTGYGYGSSEGVETSSGVESPSLSDIQARTRNDNSNVLQLNTDGVGSGSGPPIPSSASSVRNGGQYAGEWSPSPPPSYITDGQHAPGVRLLTQADLGRLVDRVTALRIRGRNGPLPVIGDVGILEGADERERDGEEEEDPVEALARRIVQAREERLDRGVAGRRDPSPARPAGEVLKARPGQSREAY